MPTKRPKPVWPDGESPFKLNIDFKMPGRLGRIGITLVLLTALVLVSFNACFSYIKPNEFGIKQVNIGIFKDKGLQEKVYGPGLAFRIPFCEIFRRFPRNVQVLELTDLLGGNETPSHRFGGSAKIQTSDGFYVDVDVTIMYRIFDPYQVITEFGPGENYYNVGILSNVEPKLKEALGDLETEEFYDSPLRVAKADKARELLNKELEPKGIRIDHVLVRYFVYQEEIQKNIEAKKLQDQLVFKNQAEGLAAIEGAKLKKVTQEGQMNVQVTLEEGKAFKMTKDAERDLFVRMKRAEADLLVQLAEANRTELRNEAMQAVGVEKAVAMKMAEVLKGLDMIVVTTGGPNGFNPLDLDQMIKLFGAGGGDLAGNAGVTGTLLQSPREGVESVLNVQEVQQ